MEIRNETQQMIHQLKDCANTTRWKWNKQTPSGDQRPEFLTEHPHIIRMQGVQGGRPIVRGTGVSVQTAENRASLERGWQSLVSL